MPQAMPVGIENDLKPNRADRRAGTGNRRRAQQRGLRPRFVSIREACDYLNCSRSHFYAALLHRVRTVALGKRRLIDVESLEKLGDELLAAE
jgi:excisionase family DNA binding protein